MRLTTHTDYGGADLPAIDTGGAVRQVFAVVLLFDLLIMWGVATSRAATEQAEVPAVTVHTSVDRSAIHIGDLIRYTITVTAPTGAEVEIPLLGDQIGDFTVTDFGDSPPQERHSMRTTGRWYTLTTFKTGQHVLPGPTIRYRRKAGQELRRLDGDDVSIRVESVLAQQPEATEVRDIKPPEALPFDWRPYGAAVALVVALGAFAAGLFVYLNRPAAARRPPAPPPHEIALEALRRLRDQRLTEQGQVETYYVALSAIVRTYLEDGLTLRAPEMTTEEFLAVTMRDARLSVAQRDRLSEFLSQADLVKFAKHTPGLGESEAAYEAARRFIEETRPRTPDATHEDADAAA